MGGAMWRGRLVIVACAVALTVVGALLAAPGPARASQADYAKAYSLGLKAYVYGLPLLDTNKTFLTQTSIDVSWGAFGPVNQFNSVRTLNDPGSKSVVAPGSNGLSSIAWLDLRKGPEVLHVPRAPHHFFVLALLTPYTEDLRNLGSAHDTAPGYYVICGPGQHHVALPPGTHRIDVNFTRIWIIGSTELRGTWDLAKVHHIQKGYRLTPLSKFGMRYRPAPPAHPRTKVTTYRLPSGLNFFEMLGRQLTRFPPPAADRPLLRKLAAVGIGPGMAPAHDPRLNADTLRGLRAAVAAGPAQVSTDTKAIFAADFPRYDGYLLGGFGRYGTNYKLRAVVATMGLGAFTSDQSIFALAVTDHGGQPLSGSTDYVLHMPTPPPANEGWSLTVYNLQGFLIANPIDRYEFSNRSTLTHDPDGSVDIYLQASQPSDPAQVANWLPTAGGQGFEVIWRLLAPKPARIKGILDGRGWEPPAITPAGLTSAGG
jgi:hypothetical protein